MPDWLIWLILSGALAAAETASMSLVLIMFSGGALAAAITAAAGGPVLLQLIVGIVSTLALLGAVRPVAARHLNSGPLSVTGSDALVGKEAIVLSVVGARDGRVRLNGGEWSARAFDPDQSLAAGTVVRVMSIEGATAVVWQEPSQ